MWCFRPGGDYFDYSDGKSHNKKSGPSFSTGEEVKLSLDLSNGTLTRYSHGSGSPMVLKGINCDVVPFVCFDYSSRGTIKNQSISGFFPEPIVEPDPSATTVAFDLVLHDPALASSGVVIGEGDSAARVPCRLFGSDSLKVKDTLVAYTQGVEGRCFDGSSVSGRVVVIPRCPADQRDRSILEAAAHKPCAIICQRSPPAPASEDGEPARVQAPPAVVPVIEVLEPPPDGATVDIALSPGTALIDGAVPLAFAVHSVRDLQEQVRSHLGIGDGIALMIREGPSESGVLIPLQELSVLGDKRTCVYAVIDARGAPDDNSTLEEIWEARSAAAARAKLVSDRVRDLEFAGLQDAAGANSLVLACRSGSARLVQYLLSSGAAAVPTVVTELLVAAAESGSIDLYEALVKDFDVADPDPVCESDGRSPIFAACEHGKLELALHLRAGGASTDRIAKNGRSCFLAACAGGNPVLLADLFEGFTAVDVARADNDGNTPLMVACGAGKLALVQALVEDFGADVLVENTDGWIAVDFAEEAGHTDIVDFLGAAEFLIEEASDFRPSNVPVRPDAANELGQWGKDGAAVDRPDARSNTSTPKIQGAHPVLTRSELWSELSEVSAAERKAIVSSAQRKLGRLYAIESALVTMAHGYYTGAASQKPDLVAATSILAYGAEKCVSSKSIAAAADGIVRICAESSGDATAVVEAGLRALDGRLLPDPAEKVIVADKPTDGAGKTGESEKLKIGMRLEAVDRKNPGLVCVATIADIRGTGLDDGSSVPEVLIHFDGWTSTYDYWTKADHADLRPVNSLRDSGSDKVLQKPKDYRGAQSDFQWDVYLNEIGEAAAPRHLIGILAAKDLDDRTPAAMNSRRAAKAVWDSASVKNCGGNVTTTTTTATFRQACTLLLDHDLDPTQNWEIVLKQASGPSADQILIGLATKDYDAKANWLGEKVGGWGYYTAGGTKFCAEGNVRDSSKAYTERDAIKVTYSGGTARWYRQLGCGKTPKPGGWVEMYVEKSLPKNLRFAVGGTKGGSVEIISESLVPASNTMSIGFGSLGREEATRDVGAVLLNAVVEQSRRLGADNRPIDYPTPRFENLRSNRSRIIWR